MQAYSYMYTLALNLYPDSSSDSEFEWLWSDFETIDGDIGVASHCNCEQA